MRRTTRMLAAFCVFAGFGALSARAQDVLPPDLNRTRGRQVPDVTLVGEDSTSFALSTLAGKPILVSPIFTACEQTCPLITANLRDALASIGEPGVGYQVLTVSFDPSDGPAQLRAYRRRLALPAGWKLAVASPENLARLLDAIDFHYAPLPDGGFTHPNVVAILTPTLRVSAYAHGVAYTPDEIRRALEVAARDASLIRHYRPVILAVAVAAMAVMTFILFSTRKKTAPA